MGDTLNFLPSNVAIGTVRDTAGNELPVMASPEFMRAQAALLKRIGQNGLGADELAALAETETSAGLVVALRAEVAMLRAELAETVSALAHVARLAQIEQLKSELSMIEDPAPLLRYILTRYAPLKSPKLTGTPTAPTAAQDTSTTQIATTAFYVGQASAVNPTADGVAATGTSLRFARADHVHPTDPTRQAKINAATVTGSRGGNAALASLLSGLATQGLITDNTTA